MKYSEIISLNEKFIDTFDISHEQEGYWENFVPTVSFIHILKAVLDSIDAKSPNERSSFWVVGSYGTGKSHASSVIKHLVCDDNEAIQNFLDSRMSEYKQESARLKKIRQDKRLFPVVLKGSLIISNSSDFNYAIQEAVSNALIASNIEISCETDFSIAIKYIEANPINADWDATIRDNLSLSSFVANKEDLIEKLKGYNGEVLRAWKNSVVLMIPKGNEIDKWLCEVQQELKQKYGFSGLLIMWDEFTSLLDMKESNGFLSILQNIAEMSKTLKFDIFLYIISHRRPAQTHLSQEDIKHLQDRIKEYDYIMEPITTYQIMSIAIKKNSQDKWEELREPYKGIIDDMTKRILADEGPDAKQSLSNLFPIHPFSAYLSTFFARHIGSKERSIFNFLHNEERGFVRFINDNPKDGKDVFLTVDIIFDYFYEELEKNDDSTSRSILNNFNSNKSKIEQRSANYFKAYKGLLLLNLFSKIVKAADKAQDHLMSPNENNIKFMFKGTDIEDDIPDFLSYLDSNRIIRRDPDGLFEVGASNIPYNEVYQKHKELISQTNDITTIFNDDEKKEIAAKLLSNILRETGSSSYEYILVPATIKKHELITKINKNRKALHKIMHVLFVAVEHRENVDALEVVKSLDWEHELNRPPYVFGIIHTEFTKDELHKVLEYQAREEIMLKRNLSSPYKKHKSKIISDWISKLQNGHLQVYTKLNDKPADITKLIKEYGDFVNKDLSPQFYHSGPESLSSNDNKIATATMWDKTKARKAAEVIFDADKKSTYKSNLKSNYKSIYYLHHTKSGDDIFKENFVIQDHYKDHILNQTKIKFDKIMKENSGQVINVCEKFDFLVKEPYGYYPCPVFFAAMAWLLKPYLGKLYKKDTSGIITNLEMVDLIENYFKYLVYKENVANKDITIRIGSPYEEELIQLLMNIFNTNEFQGIKNVVWYIAIDYVKHKYRYPLWVAKFHKDATDNELVLKALVSIINLFKAVKDEEYTDKVIEDACHKIKPVLTELKIIFKDTENNLLLFRKWLESKSDEQNLSDADIIEISNYIIENSGEDLVYSCEDEDKTYNKVLEFKLEKAEQGKVNDENSVTKEAHVREYTMPTINASVNSVKIDNIVESLIDSGLEDKAVIILEQIFNNLPEHTNLILSILREAGIDV